MASGGRRPGAGRPKKAATQKMLEGNPGRRPIEVVDFGTVGVNCRANPRPIYQPRQKKSIRPCMRG